MLVVADTGPPHYLILADVIDVLRVLFGRIVLPESVRDELQHEHAPEAVRRWMLAAPDWIEVATTPAVEGAMRFAQICGRGSSPGGRSMSFEIKLFVIDTGPLITLAVADSLDYLLYVDAEIIIPDAVLYEATHDAAKVGAQDILD